MNKIEMTQEERDLFDSLAEFNIERYDEELPLYKYVNIATAKKILKGTIKFSTPHELDDNDMDMSLFELNLTEEQKVARVEEMFQMSLKERNKRSLQKVYSKILPINIFSAKLSNDVIKQLILEGYEEQRKNVGIFCLTKRNDNRQMWRSYADNDKGVCIEFKFPTLYNKLFYTFCVSYNKEKPTNLFNDNMEQNNLAVHRWLFTKSKQYEREEEVRIVSKFVGIMEIGKECITGLFFGKNTSNRSINYLEWMLRNEGFSFSSGKRVNY